MIEPARSRKGIYLLPNLLTTGALFAGFYAIVSANLGRFESAAIAIFIAMILDGLDGRVARLTGTSSSFGKEYDSLSDVISFGLAPALVMFEWSLQHVAYQGWILQKLGWLAAFFYTAAAALRLARFNSRSAEQDKKFFQGLPSPAAAGVMLGYVWACHALKYTGAELWIFSFAITFLCGALMVSNLSFYSFKEFDVRNKIPFVAMLLVVGIFMLASIDPPKVMLGVFAVYALSGPFTLVTRYWRKRGRSAAKTDRAVK
jgi:CDP-diacylglycerol--serine O-phosphatidyltransferase